MMADLHERHRLLTRCCYYIAARAFIRASLGEQSLPDYLSALIWNASLAQYADDVADDGDAWCSF